MALTQEQAREQIRELIEKRRAMSEEDRQSITEESVVHQFVDPLLEALGWPIREPERCKYELNTEAGRPDITLYPEQGGTIALEAKRFGVIQELAAARKTIAGTITPNQMGLPGMATDRTREEQQAINYAFENGWTWAILTNFEKLRLFNARRDWLVLSFERPKAYLDDFDDLWRLSYDSVVSGELDRLSNQRFRENVDTDYLAFVNEWREKLAQDILANGEANPWATLPDGRVNLDALRAVVQRVLDRLVVVRFAEDHLVMRPGTLRSTYEMARDNPYTFSLGQHVKQLFQQFDAQHNSALFAPDLADEAVFGDETLGGLIEKLYEARYRAMTADIMGNTYEQYLGKTLVRVDGNVATADNLETRKKQGSYYTPQVIVRYLVDNSLGRYLYGTANGKPDGEPLKGEARKSAGEVRDLRVLDPACGSGSFLIYAYEVLADFYRAEISRLNAEAEARRHELAEEGTTSPLEIQVQLTPWTAEIERLSDYPRTILETHLYGVDLDPQAAELATVNLIMRAMADQRKNSKRLPLILNQNVKVGNSLIGAGPDDPYYAEHAADLAELRRLRLELAAEGDGPEHEATLAALSETTARLNAGLDARLREWFEDAAARRPFNWAVEFPEAFVDEDGAHRGEAAGFDVVVGNPPWEIVKPDLREYYAQFDAEIEHPRTTRKVVEKKIADLNERDPEIEAGWEAQKARIEENAAYLRRAPDYTRQGRGDTATHKLFVERAYGLLEREGRLGFVIPSGIYSDLGTQQLREMLFEEGCIDYLYSFSNERFFFPGVDHRVKFTLVGVQRGRQSDGFWAAFRFNPRVAVAPEDLPTFIADPENLVYVRRESLARFSPDSLSLMEFQTQQDSDIAGQIYGDWPLIGDDVDNQWYMRLNNEFHMTNDRALFNQTGNGYPLYQGKMIHQFDAHYAEPSYWISEGNATQHFASKKSPTDKLDYDVPRLGFREVARPTDSRTLIATILPPGTCCNHKIFVASPRLSTYEPREMCFALAILNSLTLDFIARFKVTTALSMFHFYQLPMPRLASGNPFFDAIVPRAARLTCTTPAFADLWKAVMGKKWKPGDGAADADERQRLRDEIDALVAHLYGLSRADFEHILGTFPLVFPDDEAGAARKAALLGVYDAWAAEMKGWARG